MVLLLVTAFVVACCAYMVREGRAYARLLHTADPRHEEDDDLLGWHADADTTTDHDPDDHEMVEIDPSIEPAYRFPGVPAGWSLDRYARDGLQQVHIMLVQAARRDA